MEVNVFFKQDNQVVAIIEFEQDIAGAGILSVVVSKLSYWQQLCQIFLLSINKCSKIHFHCAVLSLVWLSV